MQAVIASGYEMTFGICKVEGTLRPALRKQLAKSREPWWPNEPPGSPVGSHQ